jgi:hypothetical protein
LILQKWTESPGWRTIQGTRQEERDCSRSEILGSIIDVVDKVDSALREDAWDHFKIRQANFLDISIETFI